MKNKKNDGKYVIIDDGTAGGLSIRIGIHRMQMAMWYNLKNSLGRMLLT